MKVLMYKSPPLGVPISVYASNYYHVTRVTSIPLEASSLHDVSSREMMGLRLSFM